MQILSLFTVFVLSREGCPGRVRRTSLVSSPWQRPTTRHRRQHGREMGHRHISGIRSRLQQLSHGNPGRNPFVKSVDEGTNTEPMGCAQDWGSSVHTVGLHSSSRPTTRSHLPRFGRTPRAIPGPYAGAPEAVQDHEDRLGTTWLQRQLRTVRACPTPRSDKRRSTTHRYVPSTSPCRNGQDTRRTVQT